MLWTYVISDPKDEEIVGTFYEKELPKTNQCRVEKLINREGEMEWKEMEWKTAKVVLTVGLIKKT